MFAVATTVLLALAGCVDSDPGPVYTVEFATAYDPQMTPEEDRDRARQLGFEEGDPATRGEPDLWLRLDTPIEGQRGNYLCLYAHPGDVVNVSQPTRYCSRLNATGQTRFGIRANEPVTLEWLKVIREIGDSGCDYGGVGERGVDHGLSPNRRLEQNLTLTVPYGIECD